MSKAEHGRGTVKTLRNRKNEITGYQAMLPREHSRAPVGHPNPNSYREPLGEPMPTYEAARGMLAAALRQIQKAPALGRGPNFAWMLDAEIQARHTRARQELGSDVKANLLVKNWRSMERRWFKAAPFYSWTCAQIATGDLQAWVTELTDRAESQRGEPLSPDYIRGIIMLARAVFDRASVKPNPARDLTLPERNAPKVPHWLPQTQREVFGADEEKLPYADKLMIGCGMGAGLRVGELLAIELGDVFLDGPDPHLVVRYGGANRAPTKSRKPRTVELFDPGLGFWRLAMGERATRRIKSRLVFVGPRGGYQKHWPELFPGWGRELDLPGETTSHLMRHSYAVSMLSGWWGYEPRTLEFIQKQLGHSSISVTEKYYGAFCAGLWRGEVRRMTGRQDMSERTIVTAESLLNRVGSSNQVGLQAAAGNTLKSEVRVNDGGPPRRANSLELPAVADPLNQLQDQGSDDPDELDFWLTLAEFVGAAPPIIRPPARTTPYVARKRGSAGG